MKLLLSRHGNTFSPGDKVTWVGAQNDLQLTESGIAQANALADALIDIGVRPKALLCGPLERTRKYASIVKDRLDLDLEIIIDKRLNELDYGGWSGLSDQEVKDNFGDQAFADWLERSKWPTNSGWTGSESQTAQEIKELVEHLASQKFASTDCLLLVSSNGRLRYFLKLIAGAFEAAIAERSFAVKTGHVCLLDENQSKVEKLLWNVPASKLKNVLIASS